MAMGQDVSSIEATLKLVGASLAQGIRSQQQSDATYQSRGTEVMTFGETKPASIFDGRARLARGSAADLEELSKEAGFFNSRDNAMQHELIWQNQCSAKRKRVESSSGTKHKIERESRGGRSQRGRSRDEMPPPPLPTRQQPFVFMASVPSPEVPRFNYHDSHNDARTFERVAVTPQEPSQGGLSRLMLAPISSTEPFSTVPPRTNDQDVGPSGVQSHPTYPAYGTANPVDVRSGWPPPRATYRHVLIEGDQPYTTHAAHGTTHPIDIRGVWQPARASSDSGHTLIPSSRSSSIPSTGQPSACGARHYHQGSMIFQLELGDRTIDPHTRSYQSASSDDARIYDQRRSAIPWQSELEPHSHLDSRRTNDYQIPGREGRITLPRTSSFAGHIGLSSHARSNSRHPPSANSGSHRQQLGIVTPAHSHVVASPHFSTRQLALSSSMPSLNGQYSGNFRRNDSFDKGPTSVNGEIRAHSTNIGQNFAIAADHSGTPHRSEAIAITTPSQASVHRRRANR